jgi:hypothetical protein
MDHIVQLLEEEIDKRVNERLTQILEKVSRTYDISMRQLLRDVSVLETSTLSCRGLTAKGKPCRHAVTKDGYCFQHLKQKPNTTVIMTAPPPSIQTRVEHTHSLPPLFLDGCPACQKNRSSRDNLMMLASCA